MPHADRMQQMVATWQLGSCLFVDPTTTTTTTATTTTNCVHLFLAHTWQLQLQTDSIFRYLELRVTSYNLRVTIYDLRSTSYELRVHILKARRYLIQTRISLIERHRPPVECVCVCMRVCAVSRFNLAHIHLPSKQIASQQLKLILIVATLG